MLNFHCTVAFVSCIYCENPALWAKVLSAQRDPNQAALPALTAPYTAFTVPLLGSERGVRLGAVVKRAWYPCLGRRSELCEQLTLKQVVEQAGSVPATPPCHSSPVTCSG